MRKTITLTKIDYDVTLVNCDVIAFYLWLICSHSYAGNMVYETYVFTYLANLENRTKKKDNFCIITLSKGIIFPKMLIFYEVMLASAKLKKSWY